MAEYLETTTSLLPKLKSEERIELAQPNVGLYLNGHKSIDHMEGTLYLTNRRICYVDDTQPTVHSLSINLTDVSDLQITNRFLRSSAKISAKVNSTRRYLICRICSFTNHSYPHIPCKQCGVAGRYKEIAASTDVNNLESGRCSVCTFQNHPMILDCEMCGTPLRQSKSLDIKFSFHIGGAHTFWGALNQKCQEASSTDSDLKQKRILKQTIREKAITLGGVHALQVSHQKQVKQSGATLTRAFQDLNAFMSLAKQTNDLIKNLSQQSKETNLSPTNNDLEMTVTRSYFDQFSSYDVSLTTTTELSKSVAQVLHSYFKKTSCAAVTLTVAWAIYNRTRGIDLINPSLFLSVCQEMVKMNLGIRQITFPSGLIVLELVDDHRSNVLELIMSTMKPYTSALECAVTLGWPVNVALEHLHQAEIEGSIVRDMDEVKGTGIKYWKNMFLDTEFQENP
ncbi:RBZ zinc finger protein Vps36 [Schizosaccharomyces japonicus yFS275]|uniref:Vacuolar protein-sorting-associated protein 36 n=1 Tax=Schizosaccharomyces japonicus (strain yFS275 / FY16936) TaxID=402676 RepID=B6K5P9_SCHJY|nr:RBZ zinc finger protein Vps36 [Schizosaccharomyces japonicus yFS275]EEB08853.1 RBZ zinc finger protein Vps36 [Schizosaccharomyces japonicus yFS275]